jgi:hypothetical protein
MPESLEQLDLLLMQEVRARKGFAQHPNRAIHWTWLRKELHSITDRPVP